LLSAIFKFDFSMNRRAAFTVATIGTNRSFGQMRSIVRECGLMYKIPHDFLLVIGYLV
jgi:hypothetical protein